MKHSFSRFSITLLLVMVLALSITGIALAFDSGGNPGETGPNHIEWTGQGADNGELNTEICPSNDIIPDGIDPYSYLHWIFTTDGGSADSDAVLYLGGSGDGVYPTTKDSGGAFHFFTPYFTPDSSLTAYATFDVLTTGRGSWILTISHGCAGEPPVDLEVSKTADTSYTRTFDWDIDKSADKTTVYSVGGGESEAVTYTVSVTKDAGTDSDWAVFGEITVTNPNDFDVFGVDITDDGCVVVDGEDVTVPANGDVTVSYSCALAGAVNGTNVATATWPDFGSPNTSAFDTEDYFFGDPTTLVNDEIDVTDTFGGSWHFTGSGSISYSKTFTDPAGTCTSHENTATITQTGESDSATVEDCQGADLTVRKTATPSYDLTYAWSITKDVDLTTLKVDPGQPAVFTYTVNVTHDAGTESNWAVSGTITVSNPNDWQTIVAEVTDSLPGATCTVTGGTQVSIPASGSVELPYVCTFTSNPGSGKNTATATWDAAAYHTPTGSASDEVEFKFGAPTNVYDECVDVTDSVAGFLGKVCVGDANPTTFTYSSTFYGPATGGTCEDHDNTATFTTNDNGFTGSDSETVEVCSWNGRLTPGYWKNHLSYDSKHPFDPYVAKYLPQFLGDFIVNTLAKATAVWNSMNCSNTGSNSQMNQNAIGCLAGHLLAAKLNVANGANTCIAPTISSADTFLKGIPYTGPSGNYSGIGTAKRNTAINLKSLLDAYNNNKGCH